MKDKLLLLFKILVLSGIIYLRYSLQWFPDFVSKNIYATTLRIALILLVFNISYEIIKLIYRARNRIGGRINDSFLVGLKNMFMVVSAAGVGISMFGFFGIDFKTLFTTLSIVAAAIAIITKEFINDLLVGLYIGFSQDLELNDYVRIAEKRGKIVEIGLFKLKLLNDDDDVLIFPNTKVYSNEIINYTKRDFSLMSIDFQLDINRITTIEDLEDKLKHSLDSFSQYIVHDSFNLKIVEVHKDYLDLKFQYRLINLDREMQRNIRRRTVRQVLSYITQNPDHQVNNQP